MGEIVIPLNGYKKCKENLERKLSDEEVIAKVTTIFLKTLEKKVSSLEH